MKVGAGGWLAKGNVSHLKLWSTAFSNLGSHSVPGPRDWHWAALTVKFCASNSLLVFRISWCSYNLPAWDSSPLFPCRAKAHFPFTVLSPTIPTWWPCIWEKAAWSSWLHSVSKVPASFLCLHPTTSPRPLLQPSSSAELVFISLETLPWMVCHRLPFKNPSFSSPIKMGLSHTQSSHPTEYFLSTFQKTPNRNAILQEVCFSLECKLLKSRDNVFCMFYCA